MSIRLIKLISFVLALSLVGNVQADTATWTDAAPGDSLWSTVGNWDPNLPTSADWAKIRNGPPGPTIASEGALADRVHIGYEPNSVLTVDGGTLVISGDDLRLGKNDGSGTLNMVSGSISIARDLDMGDGDPGIVNMTGGTINVGDDLELPNTAGSTGTLNMTGGTINIADNFDMLEAGTVEVHLDGGTIIVGGDLQLDDAGEFDITAGTLIIDSNAVSVVQGYIDNGWITAYGGDGTVQLDYDGTNPGKTTVKGGHKLKPNPIDGGSAAPGTVELSWTLPDPCVAGETVPVDVYFTDDWEALYSFTDPAAIQVVSVQNVTSVTVQTQPKVKYYWAVDTYIGDPNDPIFGPIFSFLADYKAPQVDAGPDLLTWLGDDSTRAKDLDATVTYGKAYTVQWTVVSEPNDPNNPDAVITDPSAEDTSITLSALGEYVLQLEASDGEKTGSDTVTINVYNDSCEAAKSLPDFELLPGDINEDCIVDVLDIVILLDHWLQCTALDCDGLGL